MLTKARLAPPDASMTPAHQVLTVQDTPILSVPEDPEAETLEHSHDPPPEKPSPVKDENSPERVLHREAAQVFKERQEIEGVIKKRIRVARDGSFVEDTPENQLHAFLSQSSMRHVVAKRAEVHSRGRRDQINRTTLQNMTPSELEELNDSIYQGEVRRYVQQLRKDNKGFSQKLKEMGGAGHASNNFNLPSIYKRDSNALDVTRSLNISSAGGPNSVKNANSSGLDTANFGGRGVSPIAPPPKQKSPRKAVMPQISHERQKLMIEDILQNGKSPEDQRRNSHLYNTLS